LGPGKARRVDGDDGLAELLGGALAHRFDVVADHRRDAGLVDEDGRRVLLFDDLADGLEQALFAAVDDIEFVDVGGEAGAVDLRARRRAVPVVPAVAFAGDGAVHQVRHVHDGLQRDLGAVEGAAAGRGAGVSCLVQPFLRSLADLPWLTSQPGSSKTWAILALSDGDMLTSGARCQRSLQVQCQACVGGLVMKNQGLGCALPASGIGRKPTKRTPVTRSGQPGRAMVVCVGLEAARRLAGDVLHAVGDAFAVAGLEEAQDHQHELGVVGRQAGAQQGAAHGLGGMSW
jgi:hypothetical protein